MQQPLSKGAQPFTAPSFYLTGRQPFRPGVVLLATVAAVGALFAILSVLGHTEHKRLTSGPDSSRSASGAPDASKDDDEKDDPNQVDTIVLGDPADAPMPGKRGNHISPVHPTIVVRLPRFGEQVGLIPDSPAGRLLYGWIAAFNQASYAGLDNALPSVAADGQMELRQQTGGFSLLSAKEVQPGVIVFRLRDQTPAGTEVLGTLQVLKDSNPAVITSFSLRAVPLSRQKTSGRIGPVSDGSTR